MIERQRIHSHQLPRINKVNRSRTFEQSETIKRNSSNLYLQLNKRSQQFISFLKECKIENISSLFKLPDDLEFDFHPNINLEYISIIICYLIRHDLTVSMITAMKAKYLKATQLHHDMWMKQFKINDEPFSKLKKQYVQLEQLSIIIVQYHIDNSQLRVQLIECLQLLHQKIFISFYSKIVNTKVIPLLQFNSLNSNILPINSETYTLVLDMDETLIFYDGEKVYQRPFLLTFLKQMHKLYELILFTAGLESYANKILNKIQIKQYFKHFLYRQHTNIYKDFYGKDLRKLGRQLSKTIIIDNTPECFSLQPENGIQIETWRGDNSDTALLILLPLLKAIRFSNKDVRIKLREFQNYKGLTFPK